MKLLIYIVVGIVAALVVLVGIMALIGSMLPRTHDVSRSIVLRKSPQDVYAVIRDFGSQPKWRDDVKQVDVETSQSGPVYFREVAKHGTVNYELTEDIPAQRMVTRDSRH
ncbi:MAG TPA: SRPBCC family protein [Pyrinomonadaceae bacterium]|nr:SRPBCC family protein [Pyrinomonadaceae bacterium]